MRFIPTKIHGILDYLVAMLLIVSPWLFDFDHLAFGTTLPILLGAVTILYSVMTNYEPGIIRVIPMNIHLVIDILSGMLLAVSPWLFGFSDQVYLPHLLIGITEILAGVLTKTTTDTVEL